MAEDWSSSGGSANTPPNPNNNEYTVNVQGAVHVLNISAPRNLGVQQAQMNGQPGPQSPPRALMNVTQDGRPTTPQQQRPMNVTQDGRPATPQQRPMNVTQDGYRTPPPRQQQPMNVPGDLEAGPQDLGATPPQGAPAPQEAPPRTPENIALYCPPPSPYGLHPYPNEQSPFLRGMDARYNARPLYCSTPIADQQPYRRNAPYRNPTLRYMPDGYRVPQGQNTVTSFLDDEDDLRCADVSMIPHAGIARTDFPVPPGTDQPSLIRRGSNGPLIDPRGCPNRRNPEQVDPFFTDMVARQSQWEMWFPYRYLPQNTEDQLFIPLGFVDGEWPGDSFHTAAENLSGLTDYEWPNQNPCPAQAGGSQPFQVQSNGAMVQNADGTFNVQPGPSGRNNGDGTYVQPQPARICDGTFNAQPTPSGNNCTVNLPGPSAGNLNNVTMDMPGPANATQDLPGPSRGCGTFVQPTASGSCNNRTLDLPGPSVAPSVQPQQTQSQCCGNTTMDLPAPTRGCGPSNATFVPPSPSGRCDRTMELPGPSVAPSVQPIQTQAQSQTQSQCCGNSTMDLPPPSPSRGCGPSNATFVPPSPSGRCNRTAEASMAPSVQPQQTQSQCCGNSTMDLPPPSPSRGCGPSNATFIPPSPSGRCNNIPAEASMAPSVQPSASQCCADTTVDLPAPSPSRGCGPSNATFVPPTPSGRCYRSTGPSAAPSVQPPASQSQCCADTTVDLPGPSSQVLNSTFSQPAPSSRGESMLSSGGSCSGQSNYSSGGCQDQSGETTQPIDSPCSDQSSGEPPCPDYAPQENLNPFVEQPSPGLNDNIAAEDFGDLSPIQPVENMNETYEEAPNLNETYEEPPLNQTFEGPPEPAPSLSQTFDEPPPAQPAPILNQTFEGTPVRSGGNLNVTFDGSPEPAPAPCPANQTFSPVAQPPPPNFNETFETSPLAEPRTNPAYSPCRVPPTPCRQNRSPPQPPPPGNAMVAAQNASPCQRPMSPMGPNRTQSPPAAPALTCGGNANQYTTPVRATPSQLACSPFGMQRPASMPQMNTQQRAGAQPYNPLNSPPPPPRGRPLRPIPFPNMDDYQDYNQLNSPPPPPCGRPLRPIPFPNMDDYASPEPQRPMTPVRQQAAATAASARSPVPSTSQGRGQVMNRPPAGPMTNNQNRPMGNLQINFGKNGEKGSMQAQVQLQARVTPPGQSSAQGQPRMMPGPGCPRMMPAQGSPRMMPPQGQPRPMTPGAQSPGRPATPGAQACGRQMFTPPRAAPFPPPMPRTPQQYMGLRCPAPYANLGQLVRDAREFMRRRGVGLMEMTPPNLAQDTPPQSPYASPCRPANGFGGKNPSPPPPAPPQAMVNQQQQRSCQRAVGM